LVRNGIRRQRKSTKTSRNREEGRKLSRGGEATDGCSSRDRPMCRKSRSLRAGGAHRTLSISVRIIPWVPSVALWSHCVLEWGNGSDFPTRSCVLRASVERQGSILHSFLRMALCALCSTPPSRCIIPLQAYTLHSPVRLWGVPQRGRISTLIVPLYYR
jgi:hypothetical protein